MHTKIYVRLWIYPVVDKLRLRTGACACVQYIMPLQLEHFKGARSLAVRFSRKHSIPIQSSPPNTVGTHGPLRRPSLPVVMRSYRAVALNPLVLSQIMTGNLKRSIVTTHRLNTKRVHAYGYMIPSRMNGIDGHSDYLIHVIFQLFLSLPRNLILH